MMSITSICISRIMLSIRFLAAELISDPSLVLNNAELSRVHLTRGPQAGEFVVDVNADRLQFEVIDICRATVNELRWDVESVGDSSSVSDTTFRTSAN
jgi:hypothetical protein